MIGDDQMTLFVSNTTNIIVTASIVIVILAYLLLQRKYIKKKGDDINKLVLGLLYFFDFVLLVGGILLGLLVWGFDYNTFLDGFWGDFSAFILEQIGDIILSVIIVLVISFILKVIKIILKKSVAKEGPNKKRRVTMLKVTNSLINYTLKIIMILVILSVWGVDVLPALAGLGILGLVVGLGAQNLIKDLIAGFFIIFEHHFDVGDVVEINGFKGRVIDIGLKTTRVQNWKNDIKIFSNGNITESINYSLADSFAVIEFGISYGSDIQRTLDLLEQELPKHMDKLPDLIEIPKVLGVTDLASSSVNIRVIAKTNPEAQYGVERKLRQAIKELLDENGIEIPFPQVVVHEAKKN
jgi:small conductance mechanosensitive channel